jgi:hypothetical protein
MFFCCSGDVLDKRSLHQEYEMIPDSIIKRIQEPARIPRDGKATIKMIAIFSNITFQALLPSGDHFIDHNRFDQPKLPESSSLAILVGQV